MLKKLSAITGAMALLLSSCGEKSAKIEALPCAQDESTYNLIKSDGQIIDLGLSGQKVSPLVNGYFSASTPDGLSVYRLDGGTPELVEGLSGLQSAGYMSEGVMPVCRPGHHIEIVDRKGVTVATLELPQGEVTECSSMFIDGVIDITDDRGLHGLVDKSGEIVVKPQYASLTQPFEGKIMGMIDDPEDDVMLQRYRIINTGGDVITEFPADVVPVVMKITEGCVVVRTPKGFGVADVNTGETLHMLPDNVRRIMDADFGVIVYRDDSGLCGLLDLEGKELIPPRHRSILIGPDKRVAAYNGLKWLLMDYDGSNMKELVDVSLMAVAPYLSFKSGFAFVGRSSAGYCLYTSAGEVVTVNPLTIIDYARPLMSHVTTNYPVATAPLEMPEMVDEPHSIEEAVHDSEETADN